MALVASFDITPTTGSASEATPLSVSTNDTSTGGTVSAWLWSWGDGTTTSGSATPSHNYTIPGIYTVQLTVTDTGGNQRTATKLLVVTAEREPLDFDIAPTSGTASVDTPLTVDVIASPSDADAAEYLWNWGDGTQTSGSASDSHDYTVPGVYSVQLTVVDDNGDSRTATKLLKVVAESEGINTLVTPTETWTYSPSGAKYRWLWDPRITMSRARDANRLVMFLDARFEDEGILAADLLGSATRNAGATYLLRKTPLASPWYSTLLAQRFDWDKFGGDKPDAAHIFPDPIWDNWPNIDWYTARVEFGQFPFTILEDASVSGLTYPELNRYVKRVRRYQPSVRKVPSKGLELYDPTAGNALVQSVPETYFLPDTMIEHVYTWVQVPFDAVPEATIYSCMNKVNSSAFDDTDRNIPIGCVLFAGLARDLEWYYGPDRQKYYDIEYIFQERRVGTFSGSTVGWNYYPGLDGTVRPIRVTGTSTTAPFASTNLNNLFIPT